MRWTSTAALLTAIAACVVRDASASAAIDAMRTAGEPATTPSQQHGRLAHAVAQRSQPSERGSLPRRMVMPHAPGASGRASGSVAAAPDWSGLDWLERNLTLVDHGLFAQWTVPPPPEAARVWAHDTLKKTAELRAMTIRRGWYKTEEQKEAEREARGERLLQRAQAEQLRMFHKLHALEQVRELGGVCTPRPTSSPPQCGGRYLLMRPVFVEPELHSWSGLGGQLAAIARGVRSLSRPPSAKFALACATGRTLLLPELSANISFSDLFQLDSGSGVCVLDPHSAQWPMKQVTEVLEKLDNIVVDGGHNEYVNLNVMQRSRAKGDTLLHDVVKHASDDAALMWMTFDEALGTCMPPEDKRLFWSQLAPSPLVHREVIRIQQEQLNCQVEEADTLWSNDRVCMAGVPGSGRYASAHRVSTAALAACEQVAARHFVPAEQVAQLCQPSAMAVGRIKRHVRDNYRMFQHQGEKAAATTSTKTRKSRAVAPLTWTDTVFVSEGDTLEEAVEAMRPYPDGPTLPPHYRFTAHTNNARSCHGVTKGEWQREKKQLERDDGSKVSKLLKRSACWLGSNEPRHELYRQGRYQQAIDLFVHLGSRVFIGSRASSFAAAVASLRAAHTHLGGKAPLASVLYMPFTDGGVRDHVERGTIDDYPELPLLVKAGAAKTAVEAMQVAQSPPSVWRAEFNLRVQANVSAEVPRLVFDASCCGAEFWCSVDHVSHC